VLNGGGGGGDSAADHSSQDVTLIEKGSIGVALIRDCGKSDLRLSEVGWSAGGEAGGIVRAIIQHVGIKRL
jgi:hypothetical protein